MLENATLSRIDRATADAAGDVTFTTGETLDARCFVGGIASKLKFTLGATIRDAQHLCHVDKAVLVALGENPPAVGDRLIVTLDGEASQTGEAVLIDDRVFNNLSHWAVFLKKV